MGELEGGGLFRALLQQSVGKILETETKAPGGEVAGSGWLPESCTAAFSASVLLWKILGTHRSREKRLVIAHLRSYLVPRDPTVCLHVSALFHS